MNWENSKALTPLKRDFLEAFFERNDQFYITGGSALGIFYLDHRKSYDLDFFTLSFVDWHLIENAILDAAGAIGAACSGIISTPLFRRFEITRNDGHEILDFVMEKVAQVDKEKAHFGNLRVDTLREIGVNKLCTLLGRSELKDIIDLYFLTKQGFVPTEHLEEARQKDSGADPAVLSYLLGEVTIEEIPAYMIKDVSAAELRSFIEQLRLAFAKMSFPDE